MKQEFGASLPRRELFDRALPHDARQALFGGRGIVRVWELEPALVPPFAAVLACELEPLGSVGPHVQPDLSELVICISGVGAVSVDGLVRAFSAGDVVNLAAGQVLTIESRSDDPLRYFILKASLPAP